MVVELVVRTEFAALHRYRDAPEQVAFLRELHRHRFKVEARYAVKRLNREQEFLILQRELDFIIMKMLRSEVTQEWSCEQFAAHILTASGAQSVGVYEDGENGAIVSV